MKMEGVDFNTGVNELADNLFGGWNGEDLYRTPSSWLLTNLQKQNVQLGEAGIDTSRQNWAKCKDTGERFKSLDWG